MLRISAVLGNTTCRIALMEDAAFLREHALSHGECVDTSALLKRLTDSGFGLADESVLCSVVPALSAQVSAVLEALLGAPPTVVRHDKFHVMPLRYGTPETLGMDRACGALAARELYGAPVLAVDCGTATTVNVVDADGAFIGGWIVPGVRTALEALHERTAQLPGLDPIGSRALIGSDTGTSMQVGVLQQTRFALLGLAAELERSSGTRPRMVLTGGNAADVLGGEKSTGSVKDQRTLISLSWEEAREAQYLQGDPHLVHRGAIFYLLFA